MKRVLGLAALAALVLLGCSDDDAATQAATATPVPEATATAQPTSPPPTSTPAPTATSEPSPTPTSEPTATPEPERVFAVDDLAFDSAGVLWATTGDDRDLRAGVPAGTPRYLYRLIGDVWQLLEQPTTVFDNAIHWEIRPAQGGGVYLASGVDGPPPPTSGVYYTDGANWQLFRQEFICGSLAVDTSGTLWATCPDFLTRLVNSSWVDVPEGWAAQSVAAGPDGSVWFVSFDATEDDPFDLWRFDGSRWTIVAPCADCQGPRSIVGIDEEGGAWVARGGCGLEGLTRFDPDGRTQDFDLRGARDIAFDADGDAWVALACGPGIAHIEDGEIRLFTPDDGLPASEIQAVEISPAGAVYVGTEYGVSRYLPETDTWQPVGNL